MSGIGGIGGGAGGIQQIIALRQQIIDRSQLLQNLHAPDATAQVSAPTTGSTGGFTGALKSALDGVQSTQAKAETLTDGYEKGQVMDVAKVMLARQEAGVAFEATLQVRNKLISAYQDIMRMGV
ncbi:flagellar hook-basal body complex protein FliE [Novosphingobium sp.]|uniref:flagellar hook-basal body complex protein FliE n=1 Tax=Novosphingobium sp. TaxID=1874826 RepID=UPI0025D6E0C0|nr:flagellar hook-basal body complex protein FliE [Novosphingobium sp.]